MGEIKCSAGAGEKLYTCSNTRKGRFDYANVCAVGNGVLSLYPTKKEKSNFLLNEMKDGVGKGLKHMRVQIIFFFFSPFLTSRKLNGS